jgi:hypothetical protein
VSSATGRKYAYCIGLFSIPVFLLYFVEMYCIEFFLCFLDFLVFNIFTTIKLFLTVMLSLGFGLASRLVSKVLALVLNKGLGLAG